MDEELHRDDLKRRMRMLEVDEPPFTWERPDIEFRLAKNKAIKALDEAIKHASDAAEALPPHTLTRQLAYRGVVSRLRDARVQLKNLRYPGE